MKGPIRLYIVLVNTSVETNEVHGRVGGPTPFSVVRISWRHPSSPSGPHDVTSPTEGALYGPIHTVRSDTWRQWNFDIIKALLPSDDDSPKSEPSTDVNRDVWIAGPVLTFEGGGWR